MDGWMDGWMDGCMHACMYVCMCVCVCYIYIHIYIYMYIFMRVCVLVGCRWVCVCVCVCLSLCVCVSTLPCSNPGCCASAFVLHCPKSGMMYLPCCPRASSRADSIPNLDTPEAADETNPAPSPQALHLPRFYANNTGILPQKLTMLKRINPLSRNPQLQNPKPLKH